MEPVREIVAALQRGVPREARPVAALARELGVTEAATLAVAERMLTDGSARRFGAVFDARRLGYRSELCALNLPAEAPDAVNAVVAHPGVTHVYLRGHPPGLPPFPQPPAVAPPPNLWFTLAVRRPQFEAALDRLQAAVAPAPVWRFPAVRRFKIDVIFDADQRAAAEPAPDYSPPAAPPDGEWLTGADRRLVRALHGHVPVRSDLFAPVAEQLGWDEAKLLERLRAWRQTGTLRRMALVVRHRRLGFAANAMCIWPVAAARVIAAGRRLAAWPAVTHCYERVTRADWPYNLYAMIHTADWDTTRRLFERLSADAELQDGRMLGSLREYKKTSMNYFGEAGSDDGG